MVNLIDQIDTRTVTNHNESDAEWSPNRTDNYFSAQVYASHFILGVLN